jgi:eukaryotic-like serine/threonine-protein kinase
VLYELARSRGRGVDVEELELLVRASMAAPGAGNLKALELADAIGPFQDPELERRRHRVRLWAVTARGSASMLQSALDEIEVWAESSEPLAELCLVEGRALLGYLEGRFADAAALHAEAADREPGRLGRITAILKSASALLEAFDHDGAAQRASQGRELAARCRNPYWEGRAEWLIRSARYRKGEAGEPDLELVDAVARVGMPELEALVNLNEAAAAFRSGARSTAADLADRAARTWKGLGRKWASMLARCLAIASGAPMEVGELEELAGQSTDCRIVGIGIQALGLLGLASPASTARWRDAIPPLLEGVPRERWGERMDVLSMEEALRWAVGAEPHGAVDVSGDPGQS